MALWRLYYHFVWATKERNPFITQDIEPVLYGYIIGKAQALSCIIHAIGGMENHIHLVASVPPKLSIADFVQNVKGSSTHYLNNDLINTQVHFGWQRGYGVFSLGRKQLDEAVAYVRDQKRHHGQGNIISPLEQDSHEDNCPIIWNNGKGIIGVKPSNKFEADS